MERTLKKWEKTTENLKTLMYEICLHDKIQNLPKTKD